jgi:hypothetical protein
LSGERKNGLSKIIQSQISSSGSEWVESDDDFAEYFSSDDEGTGPDDSDDAGLGEESGSASAPACCENECLKKKSSKYTALRQSVEAMSRTEKATAIMTALSLSSAFTEAVPVSRGAGTRERFHYYAPILGRVCKSAFQIGMGASHRTVTIYRKRVQGNHINVKPHGNIGNTTAQTIDTVGITSWFQEVCSAMGEVVGVRICRVAKEDNTVRLVSRAKDYTLLPSHYTWGYLYDEFKRFVAEEIPEMTPCSLRSFLRIVKLNFPAVRIRSPRDNVCDTCIILRTHLSKECTVVESEAFARHVGEARAMRYF